MAMNRVQFQPGLSMPEFLRQSGTEEQCESALERSRWPQGFCCPHCGCSKFTQPCRKDTVVARQNIRGQSNGLRRAPDTRGLAVGLGSANPTCPA